MSKIYKYGDNVDTDVIIAARYLNDPSEGNLKAHCMEDIDPQFSSTVEAGDVIVGIGEVTILGDATLRKARGQIAPGESATLTFWRDGSYYQTELLRPKAE